MARSKEATIPVAADSPQSKETVEATLKGRVEQINYTLPSPTELDATKRGQYEDLNIDGDAELLADPNNKDAVKRGIEQLQTVSTEFLNGKTPAVPADYLKITTAVVDSEGTALSAAQKDIPRLYEGPPGARPIDKVAKIDAATIVKGDQLSNQIEALAKTLYGPELVTKVKEQIERNIDTSGSTFKGALETLNDSIELMSRRTSPPSLIKLPASTGADVKKMISDALLSTLVLNPEKAKGIIGSLSNSATTDIFVAIPGLREAFQNRVLKGVVDKIDRRYHYFSPDLHSSGAVRVSDDQAEANISELLGVVKGTSGKTFDQVVLNYSRPSGTVTKAYIAAIHGKPRGTGTGKVTPITTLTDAKEAFKTDAKLTSNGSTDNVTRFASYTGNNAIFKGFLVSPTLPGSSAFGAEVARNLAYVTSESPNDFYNVLKLGVDGILRQPNQAQREANYRSLDGAVNKAALSTNTKDNLERNRKSLSEFLEPSEVYTGITSKLLGEIKTALVNAARANQVSPELLGLSNPASPEFTALVDLLADCTAAGHKMNNLQIERWSALLIGMNNVAERQVLADKLRALATMTVLDSIAQDLAGSDNGEKYDLHFLLLMREFGPTSQNYLGLTAVSDPAELSEKLKELLYRGDTPLTMTIAATDPIHSYLSTKYPATYTTPILSVTLPAYKLDGAPAELAHQFYGTIRRGLEGATLMDLRNASDVDKKKFLRDQLGITDSIGGNQLGEALERLNKILDAASTEITSLPQLVGFAARGMPAPEGVHYTNTIRAYEQYLRNGGDMNEILKTAEQLSAQKFIDAVQTQADAAKKIDAGDVVTEQGLNLSLEEQRAMVMNNYEALSGKTGIKGFFGAAKMAVSRIARAAIYMGGAWAVTTVAASVFPPAGVAIALGWSAWRLIGAVKSGRALFEAGKDIKGFENKQKWGAIAGAIALNTLTYAFLPYPVTTFALTVAETMGVWAYNSHMIKKEQKVLVDAHTAYDLALVTKLDSLNMTNAADKTLLINAARALALPHDPANPDKDAVVQAIKDARNAYYLNPADVQARQRIRQFSTIMETELATERLDVEKANVEAKKINRVAVENTMAYSVTSATTKLWAGSLGAMAGLPVGIEGLGNWFDGLGIGNPDMESVEGLQLNLEKQLDQRLESLGLTADSGHVVGVTEASDGKFYAVVDLDGDPATVESMIEVANVSESEITGMDFSGDEQLNFNNTTITNSRPNANGDLDVATIREQYVLKSGHSATGVAVVQASGDPAGAGHVSGFIVDSAANGEVSVTVEQADGTMAIYGESYLQDMYGVEFGSEDPGGTTAPTVEYSDVVATGSDSIAIVYTSEINGEDVVVAAVDPVTGNPVTSYTDPATGQVVTPMYTIVTDGSGAVEGAAAIVPSQASYVLKQGDSAWVATTNLLTGVFGEKATAQDVADIINEAQANGKLDELYTFFQENDQNERLATDQRAQMTAFQPDDEWNSAILGKLAPESMARIEERTGVDFQGLSPDQPWSAAYGTSSGGTDGEEITWSINMVMNPNNAAVAVTGVPVVGPDDAHVWFNQVSQQVANADATSAWNNFWNNLLNRDDNAQQTVSQPAPAENTAAVGGGAPVAESTAPTATAETQSTFTIPQGAAATAGVAAGATTQVAGFGAVDSTAQALNIPPNTDYVTVVDPNFPNSGPITYQAEDIISVVPGSPTGEGEGVWILNDQGQQVFKEGDVTIYYENGAADPLVTTYDLADRNLANGTPVVNTILSGVNAARDEFSDLVTGLRGSGDGPLYDLPGRSDDPIIPQDLYDTYTVERPDGTVLEFNAGKVVIVSEEGITYQDATGEHFEQGTVYGYGTDTSTGKTIQTDFSSSNLAVTVDPQGNTTFNAREYEIGILYDAPGMDQDFTINADYQTFEVRDDSGNVVQTVSRGEVSRVTPQGLVLANGVKVDGNVFGVVVESGQTYTTDFSDTTKMFDAANPNAVNLTRVPVQ